MGSNRYPIREIAAEENVTYNAAFKSVSQARQQDFLKVFWEYVIEAGYKFGWKNSDTVHFYHGIVDRGLKLECIWRSKKERRPPRRGELCRRRRECKPPEKGIPGAPAGG